MTTTKSNPNKKNLPVDAAVHDASEKLRSKYNFKSYNELQKKFHAITYYYKLDLSLPVKEIIPSAGKEQYLSSREVKKLFLELQGHINDTLIKHLYNEEERNRKNRQREGLKFISEKVGAIFHVISTDDKAKEIVRLRDLLISLQRELSKLKGDSKNQ